MSLNLRMKSFAGFLGIAMAFSLVFGGAIAPAQAATIDDLQAQITALLAQITALQAQLSGATGSSGSTACSFTRSLTMGSTGSDVQCLQQYLNGAGHTVASSGAGSPGSESTYFGSLTRSALAKWQAANGVSPAVGYFGPISTAKYNTLAAGSGTTGGTTPVPTGTGLAVSKPSQPAVTLAPADAARVPFTRITLTAGSDGAVVVNSITVERTGLAANAAFAGIVLLDEDGTQLGNAKTLNSNNQVTVGEAVTIQAGASKTLTIAGNMASANSRAGQVATLTVVAVNTSATVSGSLPITGAAQTINESLSIGTVTAARGAFDPGASQTKEVGTTNYTFSSIKLTAGSAEDVYIKSVRWNQSGSASASTDLSNVKTVVDGTEYDTKVSADGKYYSTVFPGNGLLFQKGFNKDISIQGDIISGSTRTVDFDIAKRVDIYVVGKTFGYGIIPALAGSAAATDGSAVNNTDDPYYDAGQVTISTGTIVVSTWTGVSAQNIAINQSGQTLGGFSVDVKGEAVTVGTMKFRLYETSSPADFDDVDSITLVDQNGSVVAGPVDATTAGDGVTTGLVTFSDTVTFPVGITNLTLKGKMGTDFVSNDTIAASTTPGSTSFWTTVVGQVTGNTITPTPSSALTGATMTVKASALTITTSSIPIAQTVIAGSNQFEFAKYIFDATASGENIRITSIPLYFDTDGTRTDLTNCKLFDGSTAVTNSYNPTTATAAQASSTTMIFSGTGLIMSKGTSKTLSLKCNVRSGTTDKYWWGLDNGADMSSATGVVSGQTVGETLTEGSGQIMTASAGGSLTVTQSSSGYTIVSAGSTGVELAKIKFSASNEDVDLNQIALVLSGVASNTPINLVNREVKLYDGSTLVGTAVFPTGDNATSTLSTVVRVPKNDSKTITVKGDIAGISVSGPMTRSGDLLIVGYDTNNEVSGGAHGTYGTGVASGTKIAPATGTPTAPLGVRIMQSYPVFTRLALDGNTISTGEVALYRFSVKAVDGDVALYKLSFSVSSSTVAATTTGYALYSFTDSGFGSADTTFSSTGRLNNSGLASPFNGLGGTTGAVTQVNEVDIFMAKSSSNTATTTYVISEGETRWLEFRGTFSNIRTDSGSESITVALKGDDAYPVNSGTWMDNTSATTPGVDGDANNDLIWSPISTTTTNTVNDLDFTNGYQVQGLPTGTMSSQTFSHTI